MLVAIEPTNMKNSYLNINYQTIFDHLNTRLLQHSNPKISNSCDTLIERYKLGYYSINYKTLFGGLCP